MNISADYTLTYEDWTEAQRTHRARARKAEAGTWGTVLGAIAAAMGIVIFLAVVTIRPVPDGAPGEFFIDPTIPFLLIPQACIAAFVWFFLRRWCSLGKILWLIYIGLIISALIVAYNGYLDRQRPPPPPPPPSANPPTTWEAYSPMLSWMFVFIAVWIVIFHLLRNLGRSQWDTSRTLRNPVHLMASPASIVFQQPHRRCEYQWSAFLKYRASANLFLLFTSQNAIEIIPRRGFSDPLVLDEFEQLLQSVLTTDFVTASPGRPPSLPPPPPVHVQPLESREFM